jgi:hypothetical protein
MAGCSRFDTIRGHVDSFPELSPPYRVVRYDQRGCDALSCEMLFDVEKQVADLDSIASTSA